MGKSVGTSISFADTEQVLDVVSQLPMFFDSRYNGTIYRRFKDIRSNIVYYDNAPYYHSIAYLPNIAVNLVKKGVA